MFFKAVQSDSASFNFTVLVLSHHSHQCQKTAKRDYYWSYIHCNSLPRNCSMCKLLIILTVCQQCQFINLKGDDMSMLCLQLIMLPSSSQKLCYSQEKMLKKKGHQILDFITLSYYGIPVILQDPNIPKFGVAKRIFLNKWGQFVGSIIFLLQPSTSLPKTNKFQINVSIGLCWPDSSQRRRSDTVGTKHGCWFY